MNDLDLFLEVVQGHVNNCGANNYLQSYLSYRDVKFGTRIFMGNDKRAQKNFSLKVGVA